MGQTITEKILSAHCDHADVMPGDIVQCSVDFALGNDVTSPLAIEGFEALGLTEVFDRDRIALVPDHFVPNKDIRRRSRWLSCAPSQKNTISPTILKSGRWGLNMPFSPKKDW